MKRIRGGSGLGDSIYLRPFVEHFERAGEQVQVCSNYPDVFLGTGAEIEPFGRNNINVLAHYTAGKMRPGSTQWQDVCTSAGVTVPLAFAWERSDQDLVNRVVDAAAGRALILVHGGRTPMDRTDGFGAELLPEQKAFDAALEELADGFLLQVGAGEQRYPLRRCDASLRALGGKSVADLLDVASVCDAVVAQCSFAVPLAEVFDKPLLAVWSSRGLQARHPYIRQITPGKVLSKPSSHFVMDDWDAMLIQETARAFRLVR